MENKVHIFNHPCICTEGGIIKEGEYYLYKKKGYPIEYIVKIEKVIKNDNWAALVVYYPKLDKTLEINHINVSTNRECRWFISGPYKLDDIDIPLLNID